MEPIGKHQGGRLDAFRLIELAGQAERENAADTRTAGDDRGNPFIERRADCHRLAIARIAGDGDALGINLRQCEQIVDHSRSGPATARQRAEIALRIKRRNFNRVIIAIVGGDAANHVAVPADDFGRRAPETTDQPRPHHYREWPRTIGDLHRDANRSLSARTTENPSCSRPITRCWRVLHFGMVKLR